MKRRPWLVLVCSALLLVDVCYADSYHNQIDVTIAGFGVAHNVIIGYSGSGIGSPSQDFFSASLSVSPNSYNYWPCYIANAPYGNYAGASCDECPLGVYVPASPWLDYQEYFVTITLQQPNHKVYWAVTCAYNDFAVACPFHLDVGEMEDLQSNMVPAHVEIGLARPGAWIGPITNGPSLIPFTVLLTVETPSRNITDPTWSVYTTNDVPIGEAGVPSLNASPGLPITNSGALNPTFPGAAQSGSQGINWGTNAMQTGFAGLYAALVAIGQAAHNDAGTIYSNLFALNATLSGMTNFSMLGSLTNLALLGSLTNFLSGTGFSNGISGLLTGGQFSNTMSGLGLSNLLTYQEYTNGLERFYSQATNQGEFSVKRDAWWSLNNSQITEATQAVGSGVLGLSATASAALGGAEIETQGDEDILRIEMAPSIGFKMRSKEEGGGTDTTIIVGNASAAIVTVGNITHVLLTWLCVFLFYAKCMMWAMDDVTRVSQSPQATTAGEAFLGTNLNALSAFSFGIVIIAALASLPALCAGVIDTLFVTMGASGVPGVAAARPSLESLMGTTSYHLLTRFFPVGVWITIAINYPIAKIGIGYVVLVYAAFVRLMSGL